MPLYFWSKTTGANRTSDPNINFAVGMAPSAVSSSGSAILTEIAKYRDDISGALTTGGTSTAYTIASNSVFDTLAHLHGQIIAFTPHTTNGATVTLNVDGLGAKPLRSAPGAELPSGITIQGTPYLALYNNSDGAFYMHGLYGNSFNIPIGAGIDFWGTTTPNSAFVQPFGQAISRTAYAALFSLFSTTYGGGDGSTTFNVPDLRGRVTAKNDLMGGVAANRLTTAGSGVNGASYGAAGGGETQTLTLAQLPTGITAATSSPPAVSVTSSNWIASTTSDSTPQSNAPGAGPGLSVTTTTGTISKVVSTGATTGQVSVASNNTSGSAHPIVQPTIVCNYILRII